MKKVIPFVFPKTLHRHLFPIAGRDVEVLVSVETTDPLKYFRLNCVAEIKKLLACPKK